MRWSRSENRNPQLGDSRTRRRFAWWPTKVLNAWVWLERFAIVEEYRHWQTVEPRTGLRLDQYGWRERARTPL